MLSQHSMLFLHLRGMFHRRAAASQFHPASVFHERTSHRRPSLSHFHRSLPLYHQHRGTFDPSYHTHKHLLLPTLPTTFTRLDRRLPTDSTLQPNHTLRSPPTTPHDMCTLYHMKCKQCKTKELGERLKACKNWRTCREPYPENTSHSRCQICGSCYRMNARNNAKKANSTTVKVVIVDFLLGRQRR